MRALPFTALFVLACAAVAAACSAPMHNYSTSPCFDNCGNDTQCQASCQQVGAPGTLSQPGVVGPQR
jgi:hypothetical protein